MPSPWQSKYMKGKFKVLVDERLVEVRLFTQWCIGDSETSSEKAEGMVQSYFSPGSLWDPMQNSYIKNKFK